MEQPSSHQPLSADHRRKPERDLLLLEFNAFQQKVTDFATEVVNTSQELNPNLHIPHGFLDDLLIFTQDFFNGVKPITDYLMAEAKQFSVDLNKLDRRAGVFGTGYPFYAVDLIGRPAQTAEIASFLSYTRGLLHDDARRRPEGWVCPACQAANKLPDLKTRCKPCDLAVLKPRDVFRALPDLDLWVVVDGPDAATERDLERIAKSQGYIQSDLDISTTLRSMRETFDDLNQGREPKKKLPVDLHLISKEALVQSLDLVRNGTLNVMVQVRSLRVGWEDSAYDFWFDFVFSMNELGLLDPKLKTHILETRRALKERFSTEQLLERVSETSPRGARLLQTQPIRDVLMQRLESWR